MKKEKIIESVKEILPYIGIIILVLLVKQYICSTVLVNGNSMNDTLKNRDLMILNKVSYRFSDIERFDIVVVQVGKQKLIKRVVGLPGEIIRYQDNELLINEKKVDDPYSDRVTSNFSLDKFNLKEIPEDSYFVMGDNRTDSLDSRVFGVVKKEDILGKANFILFPFTRFGIVK